jgi:hypothetical protein
VVLVPPEPGVVDGRCSPMFVPFGVRIDRA